VDIPVDFALLENVIPTAIEKQVGGSLGEVPAFDQTRRRDKVGDRRGRLFHLFEVPDFATADQAGLLQVWGDHRDFFFEMGDIIGNSRLLEKPGARAGPEDGVNDNRDAPILVQNPADNGNILPAANHANFDARE